MLLYLILAVIIGVAIGGIAKAIANRSNNQKNTGNTPPIKKADDKNRPAGENEWKCPACGRVNQNYVGTCGCGQLKGAPVSATSSGGLPEAKNMGSRQDTQSQATAYWLSRMGMSVKPPFALYTFANKASGEAALLELPFMQRASDTGKIICTRMMTYGCYAVTENNVPIGTHEVLVSGSDLTLDEYNKAEEAFKKHGGKLKNHDAPSAGVKTTAASGNASRVRFKEKVKGNDGISIYEVYSAPSRADAQAFLATKNVTVRFYYIVVETPEGNFGRDIQGTYQE